jgi:hypothetical protein
MKTQDKAPQQTINEKLCDGTILIGYGKRGHGMNGKDADLDRIGQCLVTSLETVNPGGRDFQININCWDRSQFCKFGKKPNNGIKVIM